MIDAGRKPAVLLALTEEALQPALDSALASSTGTAEVMTAFSASDSGQAPQLSVIELVVANKLRLVASGLTIVGHSPHPSWRSDASMKAVRAVADDPLPAVLHVHMRREFQQHSS
ncbi:MAG TPA: hypothetical protein VK524_22310, partial [Polyangiaceae bacterium]|nr:hypothetical protein [Polyangiaceae bacterium]